MVIQSKHERVKVMCENCNVDAEYYKNLRLTHELSIDTYTVKTVNVNDWVTLKIQSHYGNTPVTVTDEEIRQIVNALQEVSELAPYKHHVTVAYPFANPNDAYGATWGDKPDRLILLNSTVFDPFNASTERRIGNFMDVYTDDPNMSLVRYTIFHEWGHATDPEKGGYPKDTNMRVKHLMAFNKSNFYNGFKFFTSLSGYAQNNGDAEANAECFAEFYLTRGKTNNFAAKWYAKENGWTV